MAQTPKKAKGADALSALGVSKTTGMVSLDIMPFLIPGREKGGIMEKLYYTKKEDSGWWAIYRYIFDSPWKVATFENILDAKEYVENKIKKEEKKR